MSRISRILIPLCVVIIFLAASGFDFTKHSIPVEDIIGGGPPKDGIPSLSDPKFLMADEANFMNDGDKVIGVVINGEARAYPTRILNWHEAVNDRLAGSAILVTW